MTKLNPLFDTVKYPRTPQEIPLEVSSEVLCNPLAKNSSSFRRTMLASRGCTITMPKSPAKDYAARVSIWAKNLNCAQLAKQLRRLPARLRSLKRMHDKLTGIDMRQLQQKQAAELAILDGSKHLDAVIAEALRRSK